MNVLTFDIKPSPESTDHQIRIIIDENDWLNKDYLGIDPPEFFRQKTLFEDGELAIGRCICGCVGCDDVLVKTQFFENEVVWITESDTKFFFDQKDYLEVVRNASTDFSWEDLGRTVERLVSKIFDGKLIEKEYLFDWASTRIESKAINLSFTKMGEQKLYKFDWDGKTTDNAVKNARIFYQKYFKE